ncbi:MAG: hypothetical protein Q9P44_15985 [Anaerolineae bacterium]|nr:hypothetical protein [Anaerolineae bacterium]
MNLTPWDAPAIELTAGEGNTGMYTDFSQNITEARFQHTILLNEMLLHPNYGGASTTFIIHISEEQARARLKHHVTELVKCAVFDVWTDYLWQAGQHAMLIRPTRSAGGIDMLTISLDADAWLRLITGGLASIIMWCIYRQHITEEAVAFLAKNSQQVDVWALPGKHLGEYDQMVVVAITATTSAMVLSLVYVRWDTMPQMGQASTSTLNPIAAMDIVSASMAQPIYSNCAMHLGLMSMILVASTPTDVCRRGERSIFIVMIDMKEESLCPRR